MFDIRLIREQPDEFDAGLKKRGLLPMAADLIAADDRRKAHVTRLQEWQARRNAASREIGKAKAAKDDKAAEKLMMEVADLKLQIQEGESEERAMTGGLAKALAEIPNTPGEDVPVGTDDKDNVEVRSARDRHIPVTATVISAVEDALLPFAVHIAQAPLTPVRTLELIDQGRARQAR